ncbi:hypothetical protein FOL75_26605 [Bacillus thuringiensis]|uniref:hypothetical protein n=1 Tax=Bacillus thuringiensis TaxID=1428 RepID=UPI002853BC7B|nr:hypothetical protein [Bacillus thuringiensis]MDR5025364.1 hypothetical protein [Bacillus thuringiensis]
MQCYHVWDKRGISEEDKVHQLIFDFCEEGAILKSNAFKDHRCIEDVGVERQSHFEKHSDIRWIPEEELLRHGWAFECQECSKIVGNGVLIFYKESLCSSCKEAEEKFHEKDIRRYNMQFRIWYLACWLISIGTCIGVYISKGISLGGFSLGCLLWSIAFSSYSKNFHFNTFGERFWDFVIGTFIYMIIPVGMNIIMTGKLPTWLNPVVAIESIESGMNIIVTGELFTWLNPIIAIVSIILVMLLRWLYLIAKLVIYGLVYYTIRRLNAELIRYWLNLKVGDWIISNGSVCRVVNNKNLYWITVDQKNYITRYSGTHGSGYSIFDVKDTKLSIEEVERIATPIEIVQEKIRRKSIS